MQVYYNPHHADHAPSAELKDGELQAPFDASSRADTVRERLDADGHRIDKPTDHGSSPLAAVHEGAYLEFLQGIWDEWQSAGRGGDVLPLVWPAAELPRAKASRALDARIGRYAIDIGTPICAGSWSAAYWGAQTALTAAHALESGTLSYALTRPPGHHAGKACYGGYCFINNAAVAAQSLLQRGAGRVALLDVDYHHGNGSQSIFYDRGDVLVVNIHADPAWEYPYFLGHADEIGEGAGEGGNLNLPLPAGCRWQDYEPALARALMAIREAGPDALVVSFGADTYAADPLGRFQLQTEDFARLGEAIGGIALPTCVVQEGGYHLDDLSVLVAAFLAGLEG